MEDKETKLTYEQLEAAARTLQQRVMQAEAQLQQINMAQLSLEYLFKALDRADKFSPEFITKCAAQVEAIMFSAPTEEPKEGTKE